MRRLKTTIMNLVETLGLSLVFPLLLLISSCSGAPDSADVPVTPTASTVALNPVKASILQDQTKSANWTRTPQLTLGHFEPLRRVFHVHGGELAFGLIRDKSNRGLVRKRFPAPIAEPRPEGQAGDIFADAESGDTYQLHRQRWEETCKERDKLIDQLFDQFLSEIRPLLEQPADAGRSDVWGALQRGDLFLSESDVGWPDTAHRYLVLISDGEDNVSKAPVPMKSGAKVLLVNGSASTGVLANLSPIKFESAEAAITYIVFQEGIK